MGNEKKVTFCPGNYFFEIRLQNNRWGGADPLMEQPFSLSLKRGAARTVYHQIIILVDEFCNQALNITTQLNALPYCTADRQVWIKGFLPKDIPLPH